MDDDELERFAIRRAPNTKFFVTWEEQPLCSRSGQLLYFETQRDAEEFLTEIGDIVLKTDNGPRKLRSRRQAPRLPGHVSESFSYGLAGFLTGVYPDCMEARSKVRTPRSG